MTQGDEGSGIEYHGVAGASQECQDAVMRLLQFGDNIVRARIFSYSNEHCLLLTNAIGDRIAIKSGFSSGYLGEGPRRFSYALQFLEAHGAKIGECVVDEAVLARLDNSALTISDLEGIDAAKPVRPQRWYNYVLERHREDLCDGRLWDEFPRVMPFAIIDSRIIDLSLSFWENPDDKLLKGYRRLEDLVRERTGLDEHGTKLFSKAFAGPTARLYWKELDDGEKAGRLSLFTGAYMAHRNPRAHRELQNDSDQQLTEFLLLNHLYRLEKEAQSTYFSAIPTVGRQ
jgi:Protein of unknown function (Hypoth_ymh)